MVQVTNVVKQLIILNCIMFLVCNLLFPIYGNMMNLYFFTSENFRIWQPLSHMFMHADFGHLFFNMFGLYMFGSLVESIWGEGKFLKYYLICGVGSFLLQWLFWYFTAGDAINYVSMLGASGAVMGCLIGTAMVAPNMTVHLLFPPIPLKMKYLALIYFVGDLVMGFGQMGNVANFGHIGGALAGLAMAYYWKSTGKLYSK